MTARREAALRPRIIKEFFDKYRRAKFPSDVIACNVLKGLGVPGGRVQEALDIVKENGRYAGVIRDTPHGPFVNLESSIVPAPVTSNPKSEPVGLAVAVEEEVPSVILERPSAPVIAPTSTPTVDPKTNRVFITHGKRKAIVAQLKELLSFGQFEPIVSVERETTAIPVPEKVFEDMRACGAGVIHVCAEGKYLDQSGGEHTKINDNVLIEIGAAIALYGKKVILLVEKGVKLPSNLQGLYRCDFEGDRLEYDATMKLLKTFTQFR